ncbi:acetyl/propionyl/methylcrotonyl-CoA carboxylase subunit alpha [Actibacterium ureilyticum]|uniref:acetyl/propionyl/methylcrotonyl-CoA carboxylase subunit alpha n=1 Tax=Actibacterium ureilyticum TaxID=1590614 RepID=UPI000BAAE45E|nr:acetyl/propionyl/methylcrotonyl-CoA carboxylase subunit alpha [Actibacterium ureilyticum]
MFDKILIANRGEIACRVMATARRMGVATVAVYSDADAGAAHVAMADQAVHIGAAPVGESYLLGDRIIQAALDTGAQAIHPGYGFLSENPDFVDAVTAAGLVFIGPPADAIRAMGLKDAAKALMEQAGVPVVPGYHGAEQNADFLAGEADAIGYPVLIKARAGGGGKGMRLVESPADFKAALEGAQREGAASFGDPACLIEKYITQPRHVEIQVFGDAHGNVVHLFERDCSLQRRHQKVIEEAPAPDMPPEVRAAMGRAAVEAAKAIGYQGAGTVEFIADGARGLRAEGFWFMEMNTRLQVEHPVTEAITGLDLVELQLRVAAGAPLPFAQDDLTFTGHAFEARIYAEDVPKGFLPATGTLDHLAFPAGVTFANGPVRIDAGVRPGDTITPYYDPMIAKLIVHGADRPTALAGLRRALAECHVAGSTTNVAFLSALAAHQRFNAGQVDTGLIARDLETLTDAPEPTAVQVAIAACAALNLHRAPRATDPWARVDGWHQWSPLRHRVTLDHAGAMLVRDVTVTGPGQVVVADAETGDTVALHVSPDGETGLRIDGPGGLSRVDLVRHGARITLFDGPQAHVFAVPDPLDGGAEGDAGGDAVIAPMPGQVKVVAATAGQAVTKGDPLLVLEAMKMEHTLTAPRDGTVAEVLTEPNAQVSDGAVLLRLEPEEA